MATYTWMRRVDHRPLRRRPTAGEIAGIAVSKRCNKCRRFNAAKNRRCIGCGETLQVRRAKHRPVDLDGQLKNADLRIADWHRKARIALGRIDKWAKVRNRIMRKQVEEAREATYKDRTTLVRPARRALRVRKEATG